MTLTELTEGTDLTKRTEALLMKHDFNYFINEVDSAILEASGYEISLADLPDELDLHAFYDGGMPASQAAQKILHQFTKDEHYPL